MRGLVCSSLSSNSATNGSSGAEALLRWRHAERGVVTPDDLLPAAEQSGLIVPIGRWVLRQACHDAAGWPAAGLLGPRFTLAVNLSARQLNDPTLVADVRAALRESGMPPRQLVLELTERVMVEDDDRRGRRGCGPGRSAARARLRSRAGLPLREAR